MEGLIIKQPYAEMVINGEKEWELRSKRPPHKKLKKIIYLLSSGKALGKICIDTHWTTDIENLKSNQEKHCSEISFLPIHHVSHVWKIQVITKFTQPKKYIHPTGARVWVKNVSFSSPLITDFS